MRHAVLLILIAGLVSCVEQGRFSGLPPVVGQVRTVSVDDVRAAIAENRKQIVSSRSKRIYRVRVINADKMELHFDRNVDSGGILLDYEQMERRNGQWRCGDRVLSGEMRLQN